ncbi:hypothetical protein GGR57DRAFT_47403 [Xylariaceae sp. FL1272]|nr:hypothetical protein GGR57DRAFT_47403 [Xylariaceae sp. FL1272]
MIGHKALSLALATMAWSESLEPRCKRHDLEPWNPVPRDKSGKRQIILDESLGTVPWAYHGVLEPDTSDNGIQPRGYPLPDTGWAQFCDDDRCEKGCGMSVSISNPGCLDQTHRGRKSIKLHRDYVAEKDPCRDWQFHLIVHDRDNGPCGCSMDCAPSPMFFDVDYKDTCWNITDHMGESFHWEKYLKTCPKLECPEKKPKNGTQKEPAKQPEKDPPTPPKKPNYCVTRSRYLHPTPSHDSSNKTATPPILLSPSLYME